MNSTEILKEITIKLCRCNYFGNLININGLNLGNILLD